MHDGEEKDRRAVLTLVIIAPVVLVLGVGGFILGRPDLFVRAAALLGAIALAIAVLYLLARRRRHLNARTESMDTVVSGLIADGIIKNETLSAELRGSISALRILDRGVYDEFLHDARYRSYVEKLGRSPAGAEEAKEAESDLENLLKMYLRRARRE